MVQDRNEKSDLVLDVDELSRKGMGPHRVERELSVEWVRNALRKTDARVYDPSAMEIDITIQGDGRVLLQGSLSGAYAVPCARCLTDSQVSADTEICVSYVPADVMRSYLAEAGQELGDADDPEGGLELGSGDLDEFAYEPPHIDLGVLASELLSVAYPMRVLCTLGEACQGLCGNCGANRNGVEPDAPCPECGMRVGEEAKIEPDWKAKLRELQKS